MKTGEGWGPGLGGQQCALAARFWLRGSQFAGYGSLNQTGGS